MKLKRFLTGVLSAVMALSVCALPAAADDADTTTTAPSTSTIDTNKKGSITIHKYLVDGEVNGGSSNYGEKLTDDDLPKDNDGNALTKPAEGVGFTLYKVMNMQTLIDYYDGKYANPVTVETYLTDGKINMDKVVEENGNKAIINDYTNGRQTLTAKNGEVTFSNVPLGLYVAIETKKPAEVTSAVAPFLISVPMTKVGKNGNEAATEWLYDIHVYPKNQTTTGTITLEKKGVVGEDKPNATLLDGVKFMLEKQNASNSDKWDKILNPDRKDGYFVTNEGERSSGRVTVAGLMPGNYRFSEVGYTDSTDKIKANETKYIIDNGAYFYFVIGTDNQNNQTVSKPNDVTNDNDYSINGTTITVYDYAPDVDKQVKNSHGNNYQVAADYNVGDKINYKVEVTIPANIAKLQNFVLTDTPTYVNDDKDSVKVYTDVNKGAALKEDAYNVTATTTTDGYKGFTITFTPNELSNVAGKKLYVYYTAELAKDTQGNFAGVVTSEGNANAINLKYSNKTSISSSEKDNPGNNNEIEDDAVVYTFEISIKKKAEKADGRALAGVKFDLYKEVAKGTQGALSDVDAAKYGFDTTNNVSYLLVKKDLVTDNTGEASYKGLANGNYWLVETQTVEGYNLLGKPKKVELSIAYKTSWKERNTYDTTGKLIKYSREDKSETFDKDTQDDNNGVKVNGGTQSGYTTVDGDRIGGQVTTIINKKGFQLPVTGGFGTLLFSGIGVLLVLAGVAVLFSMKKKNDRA